MSGSNSPQDTQKPRIKKRTLCSRGLCAEKLVENDSLLFCGRVVLENLDRERACRLNVLQASYQVECLFLKARRPKYGSSDFAKDRVLEFPHHDLDFVPPAPVLKGHSKNHGSELRMADVQSEVDLCCKAGMLGDKARYL